MTTRVYAALALLTVATIAVAIWRWHDPWARDWLPNFIAEWSGLFIAVAIVDRLLSRARAEQEAARREPLRRLAGSQLGRALDRVVSTAVHEYASKGKEEDAPKDAATFLERWTPTLTESVAARDAGWVYVLADSFDTCAEALTRFRAQYESALEPGELAHLDALTERLRADEIDLVHWGEDIDSSFERTGLRSHIPPLTHDEVRRNVENRCTQLVPYFAAVAEDYRALTGVRLTTQPGWESVNLTRAMMEIVAARKVNTDEEEQ